MSSSSSSRVDPTPPDSWRKLLLRRRNDLDDSGPSDQPSVNANDSSDHGQPPPNKGRGRPKHTGGSVHLRKYIAEFQSNQDNAADLDLAVPVPSSIEYARSFLQTKSDKAARDAIQLASLNLGAEDFFLKIGNFCQRALACAYLEANKRSVSIEDELLSKHLAGISTTVPLSKLAELTEDSATMANKLLLDAGAAVLEVGTWLWGLFLASLNPRISKQPQVQTLPAFRPCMVMIQLRYDETPSKIRVKTDSGKSLLLPKSYITKTGPTRQCEQILRHLGVAHDQIVDSSKQAKVLQCELHIGFLLESQTGQFWWCYGEVPTNLSVMDRTTGENQRSIVWDAITSVPEIENFWNHFDLQIRHTTTDLHGANTRCENGLQDPGYMPDFVSFHLPCDVHRLATAIGASNAQVQDDVGGLLAMALAVSDIGNSKQMREVLFQIIQSDMEIIYSDPPTNPDLEKYRTDVFDLFLPVDGQPPAIRKMNMKRRYLLKHLMNGDIRGQKIQHFCPYGCCTDAPETFRNFAIFCTWALLPRQFPVYSRKSWINYDQAIDAVAILDAHHGLFVRLMNAFLGKPANTSPSVSEAIVAAPQAKTKPDSDWHGLLMRKQTQNMQFLAPQSEKTLHGGNDGSDEQLVGGTVPVPADAEGDPTMSEWHAIKRSRKQKAQAWTQTNPYPRLVVTKEVLQHVLMLMASFLSVSSRKWCTRQKQRASTGQYRRYAILEAAEGQQVLRCLHQVVSVLPSDIKGVVPSDVTPQLRGLRFRLAGSVMCAIHALVRHRRNGLPYQLFQILAGRVDDVCQFPPCMYDSLTSMIRKDFPTKQDLESSRCRAVIECLASAAQVDVSAIECRHSSTREYTMLRSRGWFPSFESICAKALFRFADKKHTKDSQKRRTRRQRVTKRRGGGGAWRAFVHDRLKGKGKLDKETAQNLSHDYNSLTHDELEHYKQAGDLAAFAHRKGFESFGPRTRKPLTQAVPPLPIGAETSTGAIVAPDAHQFLVPFTGDTLAVRYATMKQSLTKSTDDDMALLPAEIEEYNRFCSNAASDPLVKELGSAGFGALCSGFSCTALPISQTTGFTWQPHVTDIVQATCTFQCSSDLSLFSIQQ